MRSSAEGRDVPERFPMESAARAAYGRIDARTLMNRIHDKAARLARLAVDPAASEGERTNAALAACRLIARHGLLDGASTGGGWNTELRASVETTLDQSCLCRACMRRIPAREPLHHIEGRGYQCRDCGPWAAPYVADEA